MAFESGGAGKRLGGVWGNGGASRSLHFSQGLSTPFFYLVENAGKVIEKDELMSRDLGPIGRLKK